MKKDKTPLYIALGMLATFFVHCLTESPHPNPEYQYFVDTQNSISKAQITHDYTQMEQLASTAVGKAERENNASNEVYFLGNLAWALDFQDKIPEAAETHRKRISVIENHGMQSQESYAYYEAAQFFYRQKDCAEADVQAKNSLNWQDFSDGTVGADKTSTYRNTKFLLESSKNKNCVIGN